MNGKQLKTQRLKRNLTQKALGELLGLGRSTINAYENGRVEIPESKSLFLDNIFNPKKHDPNQTEHQAIILKLDAINEKLNLVIKQNDNK